MFSHAMGLFKLFWGAEPKGEGCEGFGGGVLEVLGKARCKARPGLLGVS